MGTFNTKLWLLLPGAQGKGFSAGCKLLGGQAQEAPGCSGKFSQGLGERGGRTSSSLLPPCPAPAPARTSPCTSTRVTHAGARAPSRQDDAQHIAALSLVSFRKYKGINWLLLEAAWSRCKKTAPASPWGHHWFLSVCRASRRASATVGLCWGIQVSLGAGGAALLQWDVSGSNLWGADAEAFLQPPLPIHNPHPGQNLSLGTLYAFYVMQLHRGC